LELQTLKKFHPEKSKRGVSSSSSTPISLSLSLSLRLYCYPFFRTSFLSSTPSHIKKKKRKIHFVFLFAKSERNDYGAAPAWVENVEKRRQKKKRGQAWHESD